MRTISQDQLALDVGGEPGAAVQAEFSLSGKVSSFTTSLERDENVKVTVIDADGSIVFQANGWVQGLELKREKIGGKWGTKLVHKIKLGEEAPDLLEG